MMIAPQGSTYRSGSAVLIDWCKTRGPGLESRAHRRKSAKADSDISQAALRFPEFVAQHVTLPRLAMLFDGHEPSLT